MYPQKTGNLELPSISQVHIQDPVDFPWYSQHAVDRPSLSAGDKLPSLNLPAASHSPFPGQSFRAAYQDSSASSASSSGRSSLSSLSSVNEPRSPPSPADLVNGTTAGQPRLSLVSSAPSDYTSVPAQSLGDAYYSHPSPIASMNHPQSYMNVHPSHLSSAQPYAPHGATAGSIPHYHQYHQQPPMLQSAPSTYAPAAYPQYGYAGGLPSPQPATHPPTTSVGSQVPAQLLPLPGKFYFTSLAYTYIY